MTIDNGVDGFPKVPGSLIRTPFPPVPRIDQFAVQQQFLHAGEAASQQEQSWARAGAGQELGWRLPQLRPEYKADQLGSWARQLGPPLASSYGGQPLPGPVYSEQFSHPPVPPWQPLQHKDRFLLDDCGSGLSRESSRDDINSECELQFEYEQRFRVDRKKLEMMMTNSPEFGEAAAEFFERIGEETGTTVIWPSRLKVRSFVQWRGNSFSQVKTAAIRIVEIYCFIVYLTRGRISYFRP